MGPAFYDYIVVDEAHHGTAASYRPLFDHFDPRILLGLTATPERMDGGNVAADFHNRFAAAAFVSDVDRTQCDTLLADLKSGRLAFLFTVDKLSEGVDVPEVNMVLFLRAHPEPHCVPPAAGPGTAPRP